MRHVLLIAVFAATVVVVGCQESAAPSAKVYDIQGMVVALDPAGKKIKLDHQDIPGLMKAMTMDFAVSDPKLLDGLKPGDAVAGKLTTEGGYTVTSLEKR